MIWFGSIGSIFIKVRIEEEEEEEEEHDRVHNPKKINSTNIQFIFFSINFIRPKKQWERGSFRRKDKLF